MQSAKHQEEQFDEKIEEVKTVKALTAKVKYFIFFRIILEFIE